MTTQQKMSDLNGTTRYLSTRALVTRLPGGYKTPCLFCRERMMPGSTVNRFAIIDGKYVKIYSLYEHLSCVDKRVAGQVGDDGITDEQIKRVWDGMEELEKRRHGDV